MEKQIVAVIKVYLADAYQIYRRSSLLESHTFMALPIRLDVQVVTLMRYTEICISYISFITRSTGVLEEVRINSSVREVDDTLTLDTETLVALLTMEEEKQEAEMPLHVLLKKLSFKEVWNTKELIPLYIFCQAGRKAYSAFRGSFLDIYSRCLFCF